MKKILLGILLSVLLFSYKDVNAQFAQNQVVFPTPAFGGFLYGTSSASSSKITATTSPTATNFYVTNTLNALASLFTRATTTSFAITGLSNTVLAVDANGNVVATTTAGGGGSGTVTSVAASVPTGLTISGSPVTTSGTLAIALDTGYTIPTTTLMTSLNAFYDTPSTRITDGTGLTWSGNTLNCDTASGSVQGCLSSADWTTFNNKGTGTVTSGLSSQVAYYPSNGSTVAGTSTLFITNEMLGIGTTSPSNRLEVNGSGYLSGNLVAANVTATNTVSATTIAAQGSIFSFGTLGALGQTLLSNASTTNLTVASNLNIGGLSSTVLAVDQNGKVVATTTSGGGGGSGTVNSSTAGYATFYESTGTAVSGTSTLFFTDGKLAVGTTTPAAQIHLVTTGNTMAIATSTLVERFVTNTSSSLPPLILKQTTTGSANDGFGSYLSFINQDNSSTQEIGRLRFTRSGSDGAGQFDLYTGNSGVFTAALTASPSGFVTVSNISSTRSTTTSATTTNFAITGLSSSVLAVDQNGSVIATTTGGGGGSGTVTSGLLGQNAYYAANGTTVVGTSTIFTVDEKVGIGTTTPGYKLDVVGTAGNNNLFKLASSSGATIASVEHKTGTSTMYISSDTAGFGGEIIIEDIDGAGCTSVAALDGALILKTTTCP